MSLKLNKAYRLGNHRLICGDCKDLTIVEEIIERNKINLIIADPPYGVGYVETKAGFGNIRVKKPMANDTLGEEAYKNFTSSWLNAIKPYLSAKNSVYIFNSDKMLFNMREGMVSSGFKLAQLLIWVKNQQVIGGRDYLAQHELIAYGWCGTHNFYKSKDKSVIFYPKPQSSPIHPTSKPVGLIRRLILNSTKIGDIVYDPFGGSGSTLIACEQTKRKCLMVEIDPVYVERIITRYKKVKGE